MKKDLILCLSALMMLIIGISISSCSSSEENTNGEKPIIDVYPVEFTFTLTDSEGNDLLDSAYSGNILKEISVSYHGKEYSPMTDKEFDESWQANVGTRMYVAFFKGLILRASDRPSSDHKFYLLFGEFDGMENVDWREITLNLPNGQHINFAYMHSYKGSSYDLPEIHTQFYMNGQELPAEIGGKYGYFRLQHSNTGKFELIPVASQTNSQ